MNHRLDAVAFGGARHRAGIIRAPPRQAARGSEVLRAADDTALVARAAAQRAQREVHRARRFLLRVGVAGRYADAGLASSDVEGRGVPYEAPVAVFGGRGEIAAPRGGITPVLGAQIVVVARDRREGALSIPRAGVVGAVVVVFTHDAVAELFCTAQAAEACARDTAELTRESVVVGFGLAVRTALAGTEQVDVVHAAVPCARVAVVAIEAGSFAWGFPIFKAVPPAAEALRTQCISE